MTLRESLGGDALERAVRNVVGGQPTGTATEQANRSGRDLGPGDAGYGDRKET
jgi:hypothetical protein